MQKGSARGRRVTLLRRRGGVGGLGRRATAAPGQHPIDRHPLRLKPTGQYSPGKAGHGCPMLRRKPGQFPVHVFCNGHYDCLVCHST